MKKQVCHNDAGAFPACRGRDLRILILNSIFIVLFTMPGFGQIAASITDIPSSRDIMIDLYSVKNQDDGVFNTQFILTIFPAQLIFISDREQFIANYEIELAIKDDSGEQVAIQIVRDSIAVENYNDTRSDLWKKLYQFPTTLPDGEYFGVLMVSDLNSRKSMQRNFSFKLNNNQPSVSYSSDIQLGCREWIRSDNGGNYAIMPDPQRVYGIGNSKLYSQFYLYPSGGDSSLSGYRLICYNPSGTASVLAEEKNIPTRKKLPIMHTLVTDTLPPGKYNLALEVAVNQGEFQEIRRKNFRVFQNPLDLRFREYAAILAELKLIMPKEDWREMKKLPEALRQTALDEFWKEKDPTPETTKNEVMTEFYRRLNYARETFDRKQSEGKLSDRSKVFVRYGMPDNITRQEDRVYRRFLELWQYQDEKLNVLFQDIMGFGEYRLLRPYRLLQD